MPTIGEDPLFGFKVRDKLYPGEDKFFRENVNVAGMASESGHVLLNPYAKNVNRDAVARNEAFRLMLKARGIVPDFPVTDEQRARFSNTAYANDDSALRSTIAARIYSDDPSAVATEAQRAWVGRLGAKARTKSSGFLGPLRIKSGPEGAGVATEFSVPMYERGSPGDPDYEKGPDMPTLVPTLTQAERDVMVNDIIPNRKGIPGPVFEKALLHAKQRQAMGLSPFFDAKVERRNRRQRRSFDFR